MKIMFYNTSYGAGIKRGKWQYITHGWRYLLTSPSILELVAKEINQVSPDVLAVAEVDSGSFRTLGKSQVEYLAKQCGFNNHFYSNKYVGWPANFFIFKHQGNAVFWRDGAANVVARYFTSGFKKLVIQFQTDEFDLWVVHLSLGLGRRAEQLKELIALIKKFSTLGREVVLMGDFNIKNLAEVEPIIAEFNLKLVNRENDETFPSWQPRKNIDLCFVSPEVIVKSWQVLGAGASDHRAILLELDI